MHPIATIKSAPDSYTMRKMLAENVAAAIKSGTGAIVEVTMGRPHNWIVSGDADQVAMATPVLLAAGMRMESSEYDDELCETFATWID